MVKPFHTGVSPADEAESRANPVQNRREASATRPLPIIYIVFTALLLRVGALAVLPHKNVWPSVAEMGNVAKSLALGQGFSSPFGAPTGPTAWVPPVYPLLLAAIFKVFGIFSQASAYAAFLFQIIIASLTCIPIVRLGDELDSPRAGRWAGWAWACYPYFVLLPALFIWETSVSAFLSIWLLLMTVRLRRKCTLRQWMLYGVVWALAALTNPALLALGPVCGGWLWWERRERGRAWMARAAVACLTLLLLIAPWCWRNWETLHALVPLRSSFGEALWLGNHSGGRGRHIYGDNAFENRSELERFQSLGEIGYAKARESAALSYIASNPGRFLRNAGYRVAYWWLAAGENAPIFVLYAAVGMISLAGAVVIFASGTRAWYLVALSILVFPLTYYLTDAMARYRGPVEPAMALVSAFFGLWAKERWMRYRRPAS